MQPLLIAGLVFGAVLLLVYGLLQLRREGAEKTVLKDRLESKSRATQTNEAENASIFRDLKSSDLPFLNRLLEGAAFGGLLRLWLLQARVNISPGIVVLSCGVLFFSALWLVNAVTSSLGSALVVGLMLGAIPIVMVQRKRKKRFYAFARQLPDALTMMKNSLQAGHTLTKAIQIISEEMPDPIALEFKETVEELHLGVPIKQAMGNLTNRVVDDNLKIFAAALLVQREVGGNLNELLANLAGTIRERFRVNEDVRALTAEGRISGIVIGVLPIALGIIINLMQPNYLAPLLETETGITLVKVACGLELVGFYFIRKACQVDF